MPTGLWRPLLGGKWKDSFRARKRLYGHSDPLHSVAMLSLVVMGFETEPEVVTDILQLQPTSVRRKGEISRTGRTSRSNGWHLDVHPDRLTDGKQHEDALALLLTLLREREFNFARLHSEVQPGDVGIYGDMYVPADGQCGIWLMPDDMMTLARCGVAWDMHLAVDPDVSFPTVAS